MNITASNFTPSGALSHLCGVCEEGEAPLSSILPELPLRQPCSHWVGVRDKTENAPTVLSVSGYIDASNSRHVARRAQALFARRHDTVIDLSTLNFIGLTGLWIVVGLPQIAFSRDLCCAVVAGQRVDHLLDRVNDGRPPWVFGELDRACAAVLAGAHQTSVADRPLSKASA